MTTTATTTVPVLNLDQITLGENVRKLNPEHVASLASSIKERGLLVPLIVKPLGDDRYGLLAGYHRHAACKQAGVAKIPVVIRDTGDAADIRSPFRLRRCTRHWTRTRSTGSRRRPTVSGL